MAVEVAVFTPRAPVALMESSAAQLGTVFAGLVEPPLYAETDLTGAVSRLRSSTAVLTLLRLANTSGSTRKVDIRAATLRKTTFTANVVAAAGTNSLRLDRVTKTRGTQKVVWDWTQSPPVISPDTPTQSRGNATGVSWTADSRYVAVAFDSNTFAIYDATADFAEVYLSPPATAPIQVHDCAWDRTGTLLAVSYEWSNYVVGGQFLRVFDFSTIGSPVEITLPSVVTQLPTSIEWGGPSGRYLFVGRPGGSSRVAVIDFITPSAPVHAATLSASISSALAGTVSCVASSGTTTSDYLAVGHTVGDRLTVFAWTSATSVSKIVDPQFADNSLSNYPPQRKGIAWSSDGRYMAVLAGAGDARFTVYDFNGGISVRPAPDPLPPLPNLSCVAFSPDSRYLVIGHNEAARATYYPVPLTYSLLFDYDTGAPVRVMTDPVFQQYGPVWDMKFSPDGDYLFVGCTPYDRRYPPTGVDNVRLVGVDSINVVQNGSFEDVTGLERLDYGYRAIGSIPGWYIDGEPEAQMYLYDTRFVDAFATDGSVYLDLVSQSTVPPLSNSVKLRQDFAGLSAGQTYTLSVDVTASFDSSIALQARWNGVAVDFGAGTVVPSIGAFHIMSVDVPASSSLTAPLGKYMLRYRDRLELRADGAGVDAAASYVLSTEEGDGA